MAELLFHLIRKHEVISVRLQMLYSNQKHFFVILFYLLQRIMGHHNEISRGGSFFSSKHLPHVL